MFIKKVLRISAAALLLSLAAGQPAWPAVISPALRDTIAALGPDEETPVIVNLRDRVNPASFSNLPKGLRRSQLITALQKKAAVSQKGVLEMAAADQATRVRSLWLTNAISLSAKASLIKKLAAHPAVESIRVDEVISLVPEQTNVTSLPEWNIDAIGAPELWALGFTGQGVVLASMDTGVDVNHADLQERWRGGANSWYDPNGEHLLPYDATGHGTQVMGLLVGGDAGGTAIGVAPGAQWIAVKIFNDQDKAPLSVIHLGYQWLLDPDNNPLSDDAPDIVNNSWGFTTNPDECLLEFQPDIQTLKAAEIAVVFSAGNNGPSPYTSISPANYPESFAVGATDSTDTIAFFSSRGPSSCDNAVFPDIAAPGASVRTADLTTLSGIPNPNPYTTVTGTSFASPHVSGAMALLLSASPGATVTELESALQQSAWDQGLPGSDNDYGAGFMQVRQALSLMPDVNLCAGDMDRDGDMDGHDLSAVATAGNLTTLAVFAQEMGRTDCIP
ncbi:MAG: S8 family serine peptidase [Deltaproteobacteria bacterium]|nr:S8 family serine peptidase [Deltaproteobacteria bacterium]